MQQNENIAARVEKLRAYMRENGLGAFVIPTTDPHMSEYTPAYWETRKWISGFNGSAGTAVVTLNEAALWTDSRYFIAAAQQLEGTPYILMKDGLAGTPSQGEWLCGVLGRGARVAIDGKVVSSSEILRLRMDLLRGGITLVADYDPFDELWTSRPALPQGKIKIHPLEYAGESCRSKMDRLRAEAAKLGCDSLLLSALDEIAWTLNMRGDDVECNPVFVSYLLIGPEDATLFINPAKVGEEEREYLAAEGVKIAPYDTIFKALENYRTECLMHTNKANSAILSVPVEKEINITSSPAERLKSVKNSAEIAGFHAAMLRDGVAMVEFLSRLDAEVEKGITEVGVDKLLTSLRARQDKFVGLSFATIAAYGPHGAIVHYEADAETDVKLEPRGLILIDSGAQYLDGTTDITRTIALGEPTQEEKKVYTLVLKGHIALSKCVFPDGACGTQIDCAARYAMWQELMNFGHGTGHGVGSYLNVHEGPHQIRMNYMPAPLHAGMTVTDEPGLYLEGKFGVRTENTLLIVDAGESQFGKFLKFEPLTLCPIDIKPIDFAMMTPSETEWLNSYHATVREKLLPLIQDESVRQWLVSATEKVSI